MTEFVGNNSVSETTGLTLFFANSEQDPKIFFDLNHPAPNPEAIDGAEHTRQLKDIYEIARLSILWAQDHYKEYANQQQISTPSPQIGDKV
jgi:hypothetical protein